MTANAIARLLALLLAAASPAVHSQATPPGRATDAASAYPAKLIRVLVGYAPGGAVDIPARVIAQRLAEVLGQSVVVENRPGADGITATDLVAKSPPDGYTLMYVSAGHTMNPVLHAKTIPYHPIRDFAPVSLVASGPLVLLVNPALPVKNVKELVALAKARPGQMNFASSGIGGPMHMAGELFKSMAAINVVHIPYKGGAPALNEVIGGQIEFTFIGAAAAMAQIRAGRLRLLAVSTATRASTLPDTPTVAESGFPGFDVGAWYAVLAPAGTPVAIVERLSVEVARIVRLPEVRERLAALALEPVGNTPEQCVAFLTADLARWGPIVQKAGIKVD